MTDADAARTHFADALAFFPVPGALPVDADRPLALDPLRRATIADPTMCDAWRLRIALGDDDDDVVRSAHRARAHWGEASAAAGFAIDAIVTTAWLDSYATLPLREPDDLTTLHGARLIRANRQRDAFALLEHAPSEHARYVAGWALTWGDLWDRAAEILLTLTESADERLRDAATVNAGSALAPLGRIDEARILFDRALTSRFPLIAGWAHYQRAMVWRHERNETKAVEAIQRAIDLYTEGGSPKHSMVQRAEKAIKDPNWKFIRTSPALIASRSDPWDKSTEDPARAAILERSSTLSTAERDALIASTLAELDAQVGMPRVKAEVRQLISQARANQLRAARGMPVQPHLSHLVFQGPPGTGKTTVARIIARLYFALGLLRSDRVVEATRSDFVGGFLGKTAIKTNELIDSALDGVLFIDEAYSLVNDRGIAGGDAYAREAVAELVARMENDRDRLVVIAAGYTKDMDRLLESNAGLESRFSTRISFQSFSIDELVRIARSVGARSLAPLAPEAEALFRERITGVARADLDRLGNARFAREIVADAADERDVRIMNLDPQAQGALDDEGLTLVTAADLRRALDARLAHIAPKTEKVVGFTPEPVELSAATSDGPQP